MPAYCVDLQNTCPRCPRPATHEVRNGQNAPVARMCQAHAEALVEDLNRDQG